MQRIIIGISVMAISLIIISAWGSTDFSHSSLNKIRITSEDIPTGYMYGKVPPAFQKVLKDNPWMMDRKAIKRLASKIYPGGDHNKIAQIHVSIIAKDNTPYGDDIVCYMILFHDTVSAKDEIRKITEFTGYNKDRAIVISRDNLVVFLHVDDIENYHHIQSLANTIRNRLNSL